MNKIRAIAVTVILTTALGACGQKSATPPSSSRTNDTTQAVTTASSSLATTEISSTSENPSSFRYLSMDIQAISQGDYSSVIGKWVSGDGERTFVFNSVGLVGDSTISQSSKIVDGILETGIKNSGGYGVGWLMIPAGVPIPRDYYEEKDESDINRDRMYGAHTSFKNINNSDVFYRVPPQTNIESNPLTTNDTGVRLESGPDTINYANTILGPLNWTIIESNYNRTENIPFELLQGENGFLFRVYRNGVIISHTKDAIVYIP